MKRSAEIWLSRWYQKENRKPLIIRGARQVGKSYLVRQFAENRGIPLYEINLEKHTRLDPIFASLDVQKILKEIEFIIGCRPQKNGLLFLDEIQATPNALNALRYFFEEQPDLPVIAAGSLLEFALSQHSFSMPVGRVEFYYLGPMTFSEYLLGMGDGQLTDCINGYVPGGEVPNAAHDRLVERIREFLLIGGMPEAVREYSRTLSIKTASEVHESILETYRSDFAKYTALDDLALLRRLFDYIPSSIGEKFKYVNADPQSRARQVRQAFDLLSLAGLVTPVRHSNASGVPLGASADSSTFKPLFLDVGLMNAVCGIRSLAMEVFLSAKFVNEGKMAEQFIGQHLLYGDTGIRPEAYYWLREGKQKNAEVDYLLQYDSTVVPVEVKAGKGGTLKSLHRFVADKKCRLAIRFDLSQPSLVDVNYQVNSIETGARAQFALLSLPLYMVEHCHRIFLSLNH